MARGDAEPRAAFEELLSQHLDALYRTALRLRGGYLRLLQGVEGLADRAQAAEVVDPVLAVGPLGFTVERPDRPGLLLIGDSAGFLDPVTGEGMTVALRSVEAAVPLIHRAFALRRWGEELGCAYAKVRRECLEDVLRLTRLVLGLSRHRLLADHAIRGLSRDTPLFQKLLGVAAGTHGYADVSLADKTVLLLEGLMPRRRAGPSSTTPSPRRRPRSAWLPVARGESAASNRGKAQALVG